MFVIGRDRRGRWLLLVALAGVVSVVEALAALLVAVLLSTLVSPDRVIDLPILGSQGPILDAQGDSGHFLLLAAILTLFFLGRGVLLLLQTYLQARIGHNTGVELSGRLLAGYLRMPYVFHLRRSSSELIRNAYTTAAEIVVYVLVPLVQGTSEVLVMLGLAIILLATAPGPALLAGAGLGLGVVLIQRVVRPRLRSYGEESQRYLGLTLESLQHSIAGVREIKIFRARDHFLQAFLERRRGLARANYLRSTITEFPRVVIESALVISVTLLLVTALAAGQTPEDALRVIGLFGYAAFRAVPSINRVLGAVNNCRFGAAPLAIVADDLALVEAGAGGGGVIVRGPVERIDLTGLEFCYEGSPRPAILDLDLTLMAGQTIGIAGGTGSGKSTLVHILAGLIAPDSGSVEINGQMVPRDGWAWDSQFGFVTQEVFLINDSVRRNIALGNDDDSIDSRRLTRSLKLAQLEEVIADLPNGLDTAVGDSGARLSGGQRQRISIARALYHQPDILVLDEGTSALDLLTEARVLQGLMEASTPRTVIHVAHRLTSLRECDRILVLENGSLVDEGTFFQLALRNEAFAEAARQAPRG
jgi:ABC-type multidrug transport system fused ATPase/permease subunit